MSRDLERFGDDDGQLEKQMREVARGIAQELVPHEEVAAANGLTKDDLQGLFTVPEFQRMLSEERARWNLPTNAGERVRLKGLMGVEQQMLSVSNIIADPDVNPAVRLKAFAEYVKIAGADNVALQKSASDAHESKEKFSIAIHLSGDRVHSVSASENSSDAAGEIIEDGEVIEGW